MSDVVNRMSNFLKLVELAGKKKYGSVDWERFRRDGRDDNLASVVRHVAAQTNGKAVDEETGLPHGAHAAFRLLMQVLEDFGDTE